MKKNKLIMLLCLMVGFSNEAFSQTQATSSTFTTEQLLIWVVGGMTLMVAVLVLLTSMYVLYAVQYMILDKQGKSQTESVWGSLWKSFDRSLTNAIPLDKENTILLDHNYDGIRELDNHLPPWWLYLFYGTIGFSVVYLLLFHVWGTFALPAGEYEQEEKVAQIEIAAYRKLTANSVDETNVKLIKDKALLGNAKTFFDANCKSCHGLKGEGGIGPNLTDEYWLHGGDVASVFKSIKYGIPQKGMKSWQKDMSPGDMQNMSSYVLSLQGTNPPNAKAPQGDKVKDKK